MKAFFKKFKKGQKGFTLIELLVVVAILGVLAAVVVPNVASFIGTADDEAQDTELHNVQLAVTSYMAVNNGALPTADGNAGAVTSLVDTYLVGGIADVSYPTYSVNAAGEVSTSYGS